METTKNYYCAYFVWFQGKLTMISYRTIEPSGTSDRDQYSLMQLPFSKDLTDKTFVGDTVTVEKWNGFNTGKTIVEKCIILAKRKQELNNVGLMGTNPPPHKETSLWADLYNSYTHKVDAYVVVHKRRGSKGIYKEIMSSPTIDFTAAQEEASAMEVWADDTTIDFMIETFNGKGIGESY
jgi:hypothetical protein